MPDEPQQPPEPFATVDELEIRLGETLAEAGRVRGEALLIDASTIIRAVAHGTWESPIPEVVRTVCLNMALRAFQNPEGVRQQTLGDLSMTFGSIETGVTITELEERLIKIAAGIGVNLDSIQLTSGYEATETVFVPVGDGSGDWLPWLSRSVSW